MTISEPLPHVVVPEMLETLGFHMGVSKNSGTPKWMVYKGKPWKTPIKMDDLGGPPLVLVQHPYGPKMGNWGCQPFRCLASKVLSASRKIGWWKSLPRDLVPMRCYQVMVRVLSWIQQKDGTWDFYREMFWGSFFCGVVLGWCQIEKLKIDDKVCWSWTHGIDERLIPNKTYWGEVDGFEWRLHHCWSTVTYWHVLDACMTSACV